MKYRHGFYIDSANEVHHLDYDNDDKAEYKDDLVIVVMEYKSIPKNQQQLRDKAVQAFIKKHIELNKLRIMVLLEVPDDVELTPELACRYVQNNKFLHNAHGDLRAFIKIVRLDLDDVTVSSF